LVEGYIGVGALLEMDVLGREEVVAIGVEVRVWFVCLLE